MKKHFFVFGAITGLIFSSVSQAAFKFTSFEGIGSDSVGSYTTLAGVSSDGSVIVGRASGISGSATPFVYQNNAITPLLDSTGTLLTSNPVSISVSGDGSTIGLENREPPFNGSLYKNGVVTPLDFIPRSLSEDGSIAVGGDKIYNNGVLTDINVGFRQGVDISADGSVIVGKRRAIAEGRDEAILYKNGEVIAINGPLGIANPNLIPPEDLAKVTRDSDANAVSADGSTVVGYRDYYINLNSTTREAFAYKDGMVINLGRFPTGEINEDLFSITDTTDVSGDGSIVVGFGHGSAFGGFDALIWDINTLAMLSVTEGLIRDGFDVESEGWDIHGALGISTDGKTIIGYGDHNGIPKGWVATITTVPVPAAVWFFMSGLVSLVVFRFKRSY